MITFSQFDIRNYANALVVTDVKVASLYGIAGDNVYVLPRGERAKTFANASKLCSWFAERNACKSDLVVAVGGGCVGDVTGFAASVFTRRILLSTRAFCKRFLCGNLPTARANCSNTVCSTPK